MAKPGYTGITRVVKAAGYSIRGFIAAWRYESAFRQELALAALMVPVAFWVGRTAVEVILLLMSCILLVLIVELLNSGIEAVVDRISDEHHRLSGRAKDLGSSAVFLSLMLTLAIWGIVLADRFLI